MNGVDKPVEPILFFNYDRNWAKNNMSNLQIKLTGDDIDGTLERIKQFWLTKAEPGYPLIMNLWINNLPKLLRNSKSNKHFLPF